MLESNDFEAVVIATLDHWHAKAAIMAMQYRKACLSGKTDQS